MKTNIENLKSRSENLNSDINFVFFYGIQKLQKQKIEPKFLANNLLHVSNYKSWCNY